LTTKECRDVQLIFFLVDTRLYRHPAVIVELSTTRCVKLRIRRTTRFRGRLTKARLTRLCRLQACSLFFPAGQASRQALQEAHRPTVFLLRLCSAAGFDLSACNWREILDPRHPRLRCFHLRCHFRTNRCRLLSCDRCCYRSDGGCGHRLLLGRLFEQVAHRTEFRRGLLYRCLCDRCRRCFRCHLDIGLCYTDRLGDRVNRARCLC